MHTCNTTSPLYNTCASPERVANRLRGLLIIPPAELTAEFANAIPGARREGVPAGRTARSASPPTRSRLLPRIEKLGGHLGKGFFERYTEVPLFERKV